MLPRTSSQSFTKQLTARFAERIRTQLLAPGTLMHINFCTTQNAHFWRVFSTLQGQM